MLCMHASRAGLPGATALIAFGLRQTCTPHYHFGVATETQVWVQGAGRLLLQPRQVALPLWLLKQFWEVRVFKAQ